MAAQIPLIPSEFNYRTSAALDGREYFFDVRWNGREGAWYFDLRDFDDSIIRAGIKIMLGALPGRRSTDPRFPKGAFVVTDLSGADSDAQFDDLGVRVVMFFYTLDELLA